MRSLASVITNQLNAREGVHNRMLLWVEARDRTTGSTEAAGFWNGIDDRNFTIEGSSRTYYGAGAILGVEPIVYGVGTSVRMQTITLSHLNEDVENILRGYEVRFAPVELHVAYFDLDSDVLLDEPDRVFRGWIDAMTIHTPEAGGESSATLTLASYSRSLTYPLALKKSDQALRARATGDKFRQYNDVSGAVETFWGEKRQKVPGGEKSEPAETTDAISEPFLTGN